MTSWPRMIGTKSAALAWERSSCARWKPAWLLSSAIQRRIRSCTGMPAARCCVDSLRTVLRRLSGTDRSHRVHPHAPASSALALPRVERPRAMPPAAVLRYAAAMLSRRPLRARRRGRRSGTRGYPRERRRRMGARFSVPASLLPPGRRGRGRAPPAGRRRAPAPGPCGPA